MAVSTKFRSFRTAAASYGEGGSLAALPDHCPRVRLSPYTAPGSTRPGTMKRLIILCDGTWQDADIPQRATNVLRLARLIKARAADGTSQVTFYHPGLGSAGGFDALGAGDHPLGIRLSAEARLLEHALADGSGDTLDAIVCALQAGWALQQRRYGVPATVDPIEGWIVGVPAPSPDAA